MNKQQYALVALTLALLASCKTTTREANNRTGPAVLRNLGTDNSVVRSWHRWADTVGIAGCNTPQILFLECAAFRWRVEENKILHQLFVEHKALDVPVYLGNVFGAAPGGKDGILIDVHGSTVMIRRKILLEALLRTERCVEPNCPDEVFGSKESLLP